MIRQQCFSCCGAKPSSRRQESPGASQAPPRPGPHQLSAPRGGWETHKPILPPPPAGHRRLPLPSPAGAAPLANHMSGRGGRRERALPEGLGRGGATWRRSAGAERGPGGSRGQEPARNGIIRRIAEKGGGAVSGALERRRRRWPSACSRCRSSSRTRSCPWWPRCAARRRSGSPAGTTSASPSWSGPSAASPRKVGAVSGARCCLHGAGEAVPPLLPPAASGVPPGSACRALPAGGTGSARPALPLCLPALSAGGTGSACRGDGLDTPSRGAAPQPKGVSPAGSAKTRVCRACRR